MTTTTQSLVDRFNNIDPEKPYRAKYELTRELEDLLNTEAQGGLPDDRLNLLKEYRDNFEWDTQYQVRAEFSVDSTLYGSVLVVSGTILLVKASTSLTVVIPSVASTVGSGISKILGDTVFTK